jgi:hypothetical protein
MLHPANPTENDRLRIFCLASFLSSRTAFRTFTDGGTQKEFSRESHDQQSDCKEKLNARRDMEENNRADTKDMKVKEVGPDTAVKARESERSLGPDHHED